MSLFRVIDDLIFNLRNSGVAFEEAVRHGDFAGAAHASIEHVKGYSTVAQYSADIAEKASIICSIASKYVSFDAIEKGVVHVMQGVGSVQIIGGIGTLISALTITHEAIAIHRQNKVLSRIDDHRIDLSDVNANHFKNTLPTHLRSEIEELGGLAAIKTDRVFARIMVDKIEDYVSRKRIYHMVVTLGALFSLAASIGMLLACPPLILLALSVVAITFAIAAVVIQKAWVENPHHGLDLSLLIPQFLKSKPKKEYIELSNLPAHLIPTEGLADPTA